MGFPQRLKELRTSKKISQAALSRELKIPRSSISHYEDQSQDDSEIRLPRRERLEQIADFFDVSVDYLLGRTDIRKATALTYEAMAVREQGVAFETAAYAGGDMAKILFVNGYPEDIQSFLLGLSARLESMDEKQRAALIDELSNLLDRSAPQV